ncbi:AAA family ATPase [Marinomonas sp. IMCC 4694]|uniref:AAA family ATPase n=1 Tax=Marinomonas sp. IMCC 4694 TaxID=2605432 RepID=UPI0011E7F8D1|nr:AAA family ATPase [Marinomonas sp. IMCC 4694]TYL47252.1 AAA family ATPase [Marinomonas sp. IMCC 4694]
MPAFDSLNGFAHSADVPVALDKIHQALNQPKRTLIGLTGGPGSGKSTLASHLHQCLSTHAQEQVICLSMDGFHLSKAQLQALPNAEDAFARRGAPWTFDSEAFIARVKSIKQAYQQDRILWPSFDHALGDPIENDQSIHQDIKVVLIEGLYLLHQQDGWQESKALFDEQWFLDVPVEIAIERLAKRHMSVWKFSHEQAMDRIKQSDGLNAALVAGYQHHADWQLKV